MAGDAGDGQIKNLKPPTEAPLNGADYQAGAGHPERIAKVGDPKPGALPDVHVGAPTDGTGTKVAQVDAPAVRRTIAETTGTDVTGKSPADAQLALAQQRELQLNAGKAAIAGADTPEKCLALLGSFNDQTALIQARIAHLTNIANNIAQG